MQIYKNKSNYLLLILISMLFTTSCIASELGQAVQQGKKIYEKSCSICHGSDAKGDGIFSELLNVPTADLTVIKKYNDNSFPYQELYLIIDGRDQRKTKGPRHMPIWGERFYEKNWSDYKRNNADTLIRGRIFEVLLYLESIQES